ncbi:MAG: type II toxin-antitoxin system PemK/MazF family toxin [Ardenticatenaceae bacterium]|nr:type II toxin-antitoxin system PemK/MazF family toxin [Anaerolineales bacterium]MCB9009163.1 type II toxin-antitoxin system PemK/MazF family toxin [Ardenticatenaceae bacterium]
MVADISLKQGQIWWSKPPELTKPQPILIIQSDAFNRSLLETAVCITLSPDWKLAPAPGNVLIAQSDSGLPKACVANVAQIITIDRRFLTEYVGTVPPFILESVLDGVQLVVGRT